LGGIPCLEHLTNPSHERHRLVLAALGRVEELPVVVGRLPQPRQDPQHRRTHRAHPAVLVPTDADRLVRAHVRLLAAGQRPVALPELAQLLFEFGRDLLPDRDDLETHSGESFPAVPAGTDPICRTIETYSSNCSLPSLLPSKRDSGGAWSPARRTSNSPRYSWSSMAPSSLRST